MELNVGKEEGKQINAAQSLPESGYLLFKMNE